MTSRLPGGDHANDLVISRLAVGVNYDQQDQTFDRADPVPSLLIIFGSLDECDAERIFEDPRSGLEIDTVLAQIAAVLSFVPFEANHVCTD